MQCSHASVGLAQACPNYGGYSSLSNEGACVSLSLPHEDEEVLQEEGNALPPAWEAGE